MIKFLHTPLCFYLFSNVTGDLQNYNVMESAKRAGQTYLRGERMGNLVKKCILLLNNPCCLKALDDDKQKY